MATSQSNTLSSLLSIDDESIQQMVENLQIEDLCALEKVGQKLIKSAEARLEEKLRDSFVTVVGYYDDFGINLENLKKFGNYIRNIRIEGMNQRNGKKIATFIESNFRNLKCIELKFASISHHLKNVFKDIDTIIFNSCVSFGLSEENFCYHNDCLRNCEHLRCLRFSHHGATGDQEDKFNAIMRQKYSGLEKVQFDICYTPNMVKNWSYFMKQNTSIKSLAIRFLNEDENAILKFLKPIVTNATNLQQLFLQIDIDDRYRNHFDFGKINEQLMALERREHWEYLGIYLGYGSYLKIKNFDQVRMLRSLKLLEISHSDPCIAIPEILNYSKNLKTLVLNSPSISTCTLGNHQMLESTWNDDCAHLEELHFWKVPNAYFLIPLFINRSPKLKRITTRECKIIFEKKAEISMMKFNDIRAKVCRSADELIIYTDQPNIQSNYQFSFVKLKCIEFEMTEWNEFNPFNIWIEDIGLNVFRSDDRLKEIEMMKKMEDGFAL